MASSQRDGDGPMNPPQEGSFSSFVSAHLHDVSMNDDTLKELGRNMVSLGWEMGRGYGYTSMAGLYLGLYTAHIIAREASLSHLSYATVSPSPTTDNLQSTSSYERLLNDLTLTHGLVHDAMDGVNILLPDDSLEASLLHSDPHYKVIQMLSQDIHERISTQKDSLGVIDTYLSSIIPEVRDVVSIEKASVTSEVSLTLSNDLGVKKLRVVDTNDRIEKEKIASDMMKVEERESRLLSMKSLQEGRGMRSDLQALKSLIMHSEAIEHELVHQYGSHASEARMFMAAMSTLNLRASKNGSSADIERKKLEKCILEWSKSSDLGKNKMLSILNKVVFNANGSDFSRVSSPSMMTSSTVDIVDKISISQMFKPEVRSTGRDQGDFMIPEKYLNVLNHGADLEPFTYSMRTSSSHMRDLSTIHGASQLSMMHATGSSSSETSASAVNFGAIMRIMENPYFQFIIGELKVRWEASSMEEVVGLFIQRFLQYDDDHVLLPLFSLSSDTVALGEEEVILRSSMTLSVLRMILKLGTQVDLDVFSNIRYPMRDIEPVSIASIMLEKLTSLNRSISSVVDSFSLKELHSLDEVGVKGTQPVNVDDVEGEYSLWHESSAMARLIHSNKSTWWGTSSAAEGDKDRIFDDNKHHKLMQSLRGHVESSNVSPAHKEEVLRLVRATQEKDSDIEDTIRKILKTYIFEFHVFPEIHSFEVDKVCDDVLHAPHIVPGIKEAISKLDSLRRLRSEVEKELEELERDNLSVTRRVEEEEAAITSYVDHLSHRKDHVLCLLDEFLLKINDLSTVEEGQVFQKLIERIKSKIPRIVVEKKLVEEFLVPGDVFGNSVALDFTMSETPPNALLEGMDGYLLTHFNGDQVHDTPSDIAMKLIKEKDEDDDGKCVMLFDSPLNYYESMHSVGVGLSFSSSEGASEITIKVIHDINKCSDNISLSFKVIPHESLIARPSVTRVVESRGGRLYVNDRQVPSLSRHSWEGAEVVLPITLTDDMHIWKTVASSSDLKVELLFHGVSIKERVYPILQLPQGVEFFLVHPSETKRSFLAWEVSEPYFSFKECLYDLNRKISEHFMGTLRLKEMDMISESLGMESPSGRGRIDSMSVKKKMEEEVEEEIMKMKTINRKMEFELQSVMRLNERLQEEVEEIRIYQSLCEESKLEMELKEMKFLLSSKEGAFSPTKRSNEITMLDDEIEKAIREISKRETTYFIASNPDPMSPTLPPPLLSPSTTITSYQGGSPISVTYSPVKVTGATPLISSRQGSPISVSHTPMKILTETPSSRKKERNMNGEQGITSTIEKEEDEKERIEKDETIRKIQVEKVRVMKEQRGQQNGWGLQSLTRWG